ncbi:hypothetical protein ACHQM5_011009 [Ranunculus cassubicifolius]
MNSIAKRTPTIANQLVSIQQCRGIQVRVKDGNLDKALTIMERRMQESGMERLIKRSVLQTYHLKNSEKRVLAGKTLQLRLRSQDLSRKLQAIISKKIRFSPC